MARADGWFMCRVGFLETARAVSVAGSPSAVRAVHGEWPAFGVIEVDQDLVERAIELALAHDLRSLDALHLADDGSRGTRRKREPHAWERRVCCSGRGAFWCRFARGGGGCQRGSVGDIDLAVDVREVDFDGRGRDEHPLRDCSVRQPFARELDDP
jgi:hypothetical protein